MISSPSSVVFRVSFPCFVSLRDESYHLPRLFTGSSETVGMTWFAMLKVTDSSTFPFRRDRLLDFFGLNSIPAAATTSSSLSRISRVSSSLLERTVVSSMKAFKGGGWQLGLLSLSVWLEAALSITSIARTNRIGEIAHPMAMPTSKSIHLVVYSFVENRIEKPLK